MTLHSINTDANVQDELLETAVASVKALADHMARADGTSLQAARAFDLMADLIRLRRDCVSLERHRQLMKRVTGGTNAL